VRKKWEEMYKKLSKKLKEVKVNEDDDESESEQPFEVDSSALYDEVDMVSV
jgi:hypothetical protein